MGGVHVAAPPMRTVAIPSRFNGPPATANGGYASGAVARLLDARAAEVTLRQPPPLDEALAVERDADGVRLRRDDESLVAEGRALDALALDALALEVPEPITLGSAYEASHRYPWRERHHFPTCFVCGPRREDGDGLAIFTGPVAGREALDASHWLPTSEWADASGDVRSEIVWAALDCPSAVAVARFGAFEETPAVLARLTASLEAPVRADEPHIVLAWPLERDDRKLEAGSAIIGPDGTVRARARALWIELEGHPPA
jgi:hypothetical protein